MNYGGNSMSILETTDLRREMVRKNLIDMVLVKEHLENIKASSLQEMQTNIRKLVNKLYPQIKIFSWVQSIDKFVVIHVLENGEQYEIPLIRENYYNYIVNKDFLLHTVNYSQNGQVFTQYICPKCKTIHWSDIPYEEVKCLGCKKVFHRSDLEPLE
jgi:hypothetical protein